MPCCGPIWRRTSRLFARVTYFQRLSELLEAGHVWTSADGQLTISGAAGDLKDLSIPSSKQFEALKRDRKGEYSIRINQQWRICFNWRDGHAFDVEVVDYHQAGIAVR